MWKSLLGALRGLSSGLVLKNTWGVVRGKFFSDGGGTETDQSIALRFILMGSSVLDTFPLRELR